MFLIIFCTILLCLLTYWWYTVSNRRHKLRWIPTVPGLPLIGNALEFQDSKEFVHVFTKYANRYNGLCRLEAFTLSGILASDYDFLEFLLTSPNILNKSKEYEYLNCWLGTGLLTAPGPKWKTRRKIITPAFHFSILEQFVEVFESNGNILIDILHKQDFNKPINIYPFINMGALDIICEAAMGVPINAQTNIHSDYVKAVKEMCRISVGRGINPLKLFDLTYPLTRDYYTQKKSIDILHSHTNSVIKTRMEQLKNKVSDEKDTKDEGLGVKKKEAFLDLLLEYTVDGLPLSQNDIREEVDTFMFEGHDTTSSAMSFTLFNLAKYPDIQAQAVEEQKTLFGSEKDKQLTYRDLQDMKYLESVIKESLRLYPPVPFIGRKTDKETEYKDGNVIPKNIDIIIFIYGLNRNSSYFENPEKFDPSRFYSMDAQLPFAYIPFSAGPRNCIGQKFAMLEIKSIISKVLRNFELQYAGPELEPIIASEVVLKSLNGVNVKIKKRQWSS